MKKLLFFLVLFANFAFSQMPNIEGVWLNKSKPYVGTIGNKNQEIKVKFSVSEQNKKNDQQYFISGYSLVDQVYGKLEGNITITKYKNSGKKSKVYGTYEWLEEPKGKHSGKFTGKFMYAFEWDASAEKIENETVEFTGDWKSYDGSLDFKTKLKNQ